MEKGDASRRIETLRTLLRVALAGGALAIGHVATLAQRRWLVIVEYGANIGVGGWIPWLSLFALAGGLFGLAMWLPRRVGYRLGPPVLIGFLPLLVLIYAIGYLGYAPYFLGYENSPLLTEEPPIYDQVPLLAFLIGLSIASGFMETGKASRVR